jgi:DNA-binding beta-propeller fold protein YncE
LSNPIGLAFDSNGNLYAANYSGETIAKFTPGGAGSTFENGYLDLSFGLAIDTANNVYVANSYDEQNISKITPAGDLTFFATTGVGSAVGLAFAHNGNLYSADAGGNTVEKWTSADTGTTFASTGLDVPYGIAFDDNANLYVVNNGNNTIEKFTPSGVGSLFSSSGLDDPTFIVIVPEPAPWTILAVGLGVIAGFRRLRSVLPYSCRWVLRMDAGQIANLLHETASRIILHGRTVA